MTWWLKSRASRNIFWNLPLASGKIMDFSPPQKNKKNQQSCVSLCWRSWSLGQGHLPLLSSSGRLACVSSGRQSAPQSHCYFFQAKDLTSEHSRVLSFYLCNLASNLSVCLKIVAILCLFLLLLFLFCFVSLGVAVDESSNCTIIPYFKLFLLTC